VVEVVAAAGEGDVVVADHSAIKNLPTLGVGLGYRERYRSDLFLNRSSVDFLEITADHFFDATGEKLEELELLAENFVLIPHGLSMSFGSAEGLDSAYVEKFAGLVEKLNPPWWSEHIAFTRAGGVDIGHLTPLPFSSEAVDVLCRNIAEAKKQISTPLILENISFNLRFPGAEMTEGQFITRLLENSGAGLLLDVTNLYGNSRNHRYDPSEFLDELPLDRVVQLHFVGGLEQEGRFIDSHSTETPEPIWQLLAEVLQRCQVKGMILERDENFPPYPELRRELSRARQLFKGVPSQ
jgi:uncharacterized protein (UPF0276 family)